MTAWLLFIHDTSNLHMTGTTGFYRITARLILLTALAAITACASVPFDYPAPHSYAQPTNPDTELGEGAIRWQQNNPGYSGIVRLPDGIDALGARLRMMELAETSIDAQYFILKNDRAGALFVGKMLLAADRGVRVRLLIDDVFTTGIDRQLTLMNSHPNIQVRLFNPLSRQSFKYWSYLVDFERANRRMHNKSFTADNTLTIVGGRNIGEEYFELDQDILFDDYEVLAIGPVVPEVSAGFDEFWNSELSVPVEAFKIKVDPAELDKWRAYMQEQVAPGSSSIYAQALDSKLLSNIKQGRVQPTLAEATIVTDSPDKLLQQVGDAQMAVLARDIGQRFRAAQKEILIVTPYFIPQESGTKLLESLLEKGIRVVIVTNSLAATNHVAVHSGYARYRKRLLQAGAKIYEIRAKNTGRKTDWGHSPEMVTLHSKASAVDRSTVFVGSLNFDPRSILINTEMGMFIESRELGVVFTANLFKELPRVAYRVYLDDQGALRWTYDYDGHKEVHDHEPQTTWSRRFMAGFYGLLPIEGQL